MTNRYHIDGQAVGPLTPAPGPAPPRRTPSPARPWLLYGAYGYTGRLLLEEALALGHRPILGGRSRERLEALRDLGVATSGEPEDRLEPRLHPSAEGPEGARGPRSSLQKKKPLDLDIRAFALEGPDVARHLQGVDVVLHAAGPFLHTGAPMMDACLKVGAHYLDITGEVPVFEAAFDRSEAAKQRGIVLMPGVGMDVVPTDAIAALLAAALPGASRLELALQASGRPSAGTLHTVVEGLRAGLVIRRDGGLTTAWPGAGRFRREVDFGPGGVWPVVPLTWGDLSTAWRTTGIPDLACYLAVSRTRARLLPWVLPLLRPIFRLEAARNWVHRRISAGPDGPDAVARARGRTMAWGRVEGDETDQWAELVLELPEAYRFTAAAGIRALEAVCEETAAGRLAPGTHTPAGALGPSWALGLPGVEVVARRGLARGG